MADPLAEPSAAPQRGRRRTSRVLDRNVRALVEHRAEEVRGKTPGERIADVIARFAGSMPSLYLHLTVLGVWLVLNSGLFRIRSFDPSFALLGTCASVEAIFLATFVLITQNRMADMAETRAHLGLQVGLLSEHETTRILRLVAAMSEQMGIKEAQDPELDELSRDVAPEDVLKQIEVHTDAVQREKQEQEDNAGGQ
ncbi:MAG: DUF1003 domain-containing protein [Gemmatimonadaceae bacterium]